MRRAFLPFFCAVLAACGDDEPTNTADTSDPSDTVETDTADTVAPDTTVPDTIPDTTVPDTIPDTTVPDTIPDTTPGPTGGTCPQMFSCAVECTSATCTEGCLDAADDADETRYITEYLACLDTNDCSFVTMFSTPQETRTAIECERTSCLLARATCHSGGVSGSGTCAVLAQCLRICDEADIACQRTCLSAASEQATLAYFDVTLCTQRECFDQPNFQTCVQQATSSIGPCSVTYNACYGDTGAAPGAAGGGGLP